jgi:hypothetical protein
MTSYLHFAVMVYDVVSTGLVRVQAKNGARCREQ